MSNKTITRPAVKASTLEGAIDSMKELNGWCIRMTKQVEEGGGMDQLLFWEVFQPDNNHGTYTLRKKYGINPNVYCRDGAIGRTAFSVNRRYLATKVQQKLFSGWKYSNKMIKEREFDWVSNSHIPEHHRGLEAPEPEKPKRRTWIHAHAPATTHTGTHPGKHPPTRHRKPRPPRPKKEEISSEERLIDELMGPSLTPIEKVCGGAELKTLMKRRKKVTDW